MGGEERERGEREGGRGERLINYDISEMGEVLIMTDNENEAWKASPVCLQLEEWVTEHEESQGANESTTLTYLYSDIGPHWPAKQTWHCIMKVHLPSTPYGRVLTST